MLVIGLGGVGGYLCRFLSKAILYDQLPQDTEITVADMDAVEPKNTKYQDYEQQDILKNKAEIIGQKYNFTYLKEKIEDISQLVPYDVILLCVDNNKTRKLVYHFCANNSTYWIDGRAEGREIAVFTKSKRNTPAEMAKLTGENVEDASCQREWQIRENIINYGHIIASAIIFQLLLNHIRNENHQDRIIMRV